MSGASTITAYAALAFVVMGVGGVHTAVVGIACVLMSVAACVQIAVRRREGEGPVYVSALGAALAIMTIASLIQLIPVPEFLQRLLNPRGFDLVQRGLELIGVRQVGLRPLSLDPAATADRAMRFATLTAAAIWAANVASRRAWVRLGIFVVATAVVTLGLGRFLSVRAGKSVYGFYDSPVGFRGWSTFISLNHGAAFFGFAAICAVGVALYYRSKRPRVSGLLALAGLVFVGAAVAHHSDGVLLAMFATTAAVAVLAWFRAGRPTAMPRDVAFGVGLLAFVSAIVGWWLDVHLAIARFVEAVFLSGEHGARLALMQAGVAAVTDYWPFGAGAGTAQTVIPAYVDWSEVVPSSIPVLENDVLEVLFGFGIIIGALPLLGFALQVVGATRRAINPKRGMRYAVAVASALYFAIIAQLHFPVFTLGLGLPMVVWLEQLWGRGARPAGGRRVFGTGHVFVPALAVIALVLTLGLGALVAAQAHYRWYDAELPTEPDDAQAERVVRLRPAAHDVYVRLATLAAREGDLERAVELAEYAARREPTPRVRFFFARAAALVDPQRSAELYGELFEEGYLGGSVIEAMLADLRSSELRVRAVEKRPDAWLRTALRILAVDGADAASDFVVTLASTKSGEKEVYRVGTRIYLRMSRPTLSRLWAELLAELERGGPATDRTAPFFMARALHRAGETARAREVLDRALNSDVVEPDVHRLALQLRGDVSDVTPADVERVGEHHARLCRSPVPVRELRLCWDTEAWIAEASDRYGVARSVYQRIARRFDDPIPLARFLFRNGLCKELGQLGETLVPRSRTRRRVDALAAKCRTQ